MATVKELMKQLKAGSVSVEGVAEQIRSKTFRKVQKSQSIDDIDLTGDPEPAGDDDFFGVGMAYMRGDINDEEYEILANAT